MKFLKNILCVFLLFISSILEARPVLFVATGPSNEVIKIDLSTNKVIGKIGELENAHGLAGHPTSEYLVAGSMNRGGKKQSMKPSSVSEEDHKAHHAAQSKQGKSSEQHSFVSIVHPKHGHVMRRVKVQGITHHTAVSPNGKEAIAVHSTLGGISVLDLNKMSVITTVKTGQVPNYAVYSHGGKFVFVSNAGSGTVSKVSTKNWDITDQINVGKGPEHLAMSSDGKSLFALNVISGSVSIIDVGHSRVIKEVKVGKSPHGLAPSPDGKWLFVSNKGGDSLSRISLLDFTKQNISLSPAPYHLEYISDVNKVYVSSRKKPLIWVIDPISLQIVNEIQFEPGVAHQMVVMDE